MPDFYPDIEDFLAFKKTTKSISLKGIEVLVYRVRSITGLDYDTAAMVVRCYFEEVRNAMLRGEVVSFGGIGKLQITSAITGNKRTDFKIKNYPAFIKKINEKN